MKYLIEGSTERLFFRAISPHDFAQWVAFFNDPSSFEHWKGEFKAPEIECKKWFDRQRERYANDEGGMNALIEKNSGKLIGFSGLLVQFIDGTAELEVAYSLLPDFRNKGFATEAAMKCVTMLFKIILPTP